MILENHIDTLVGAVLLDRKLRETILQDRVAAIERYNTGYARRYEQKKVELTDEEALLLSSADVRNLNQLFELLATSLNSRPGRPATDTSLAASLFYDNLRSEALPTRIGKTPAKSSAA